MTEEKQPAPEEPTPEEEKEESTSDIPTLEEAKESQEEPIELTDFSPEEKTKENFQCIQAQIHTCNAGCQLIN